MVDKFSRDERSAIMRKVKSKKNKSTEIKTISFLKFYSIKGWRRNYKIFGKPDFVFLSKKIAIFADGCFWHGHDCRNTRPINNADYWREKIKYNKSRAEKVENHLKGKKWKVIRIWECEINNKKLWPIIYQKFLRLLANTNSPNDD